MYEQCHAEQDGNDRSGRVGEAFLFHCGICGLRLGNFPERNYETKKKR